ncbi:MAG TPA: DMT family transporter [Thiolinea sp.]|nr:DMT family transporter [Thiolinea sp.]
MPAQPEARDWLSLLGLILLWGTSFLCVSLSLESFSPTGIVAMRVLLAAVVLTLAVWLRRLRFPRDQASWLLFGLLGIVGNLLPFYLISTGQQHVSSGIAGLLMAIMPLITMLLAHYLVPGETLNRYKLLGFGLGITGVGIILLPKMSTGDSSLPSSLLILLAAGSYALNSILIRRYSRHHVLVASAGVMIMASLLILPIWLWQENPLQQSRSLTSVLALVWLGLGPTGIATLLYFSVVARAGPTFLANINYFVPVVAYLTGALILSEPLEWHSLSALLLIIAGIGLTRRRPPATPWYHRQA